MTPGASFFVLIGSLAVGAAGHFAEDPDAALNETYRVLKPAGIRVPTVSHPNYVEPLRNLVSRIIVGRFERREMGRGLRNSVR